RLVAAAVRELEAKRRSLGHVDRLGHDLAAVAIVPRDHAGHLGLLLEGAANLHRDAAARPEPSAPWGVVDLDLDRLDADQVALLPGPRELPLRGPAEPAGPDLLQRLPLALVGALLHEENPGPRRAIFVIVVARRQHHPLAREVDRPGISRLDPPGERTEALAVGR